ncbi:predicted protein [Nematostella vectensis]|uniref:Hexosyltransferase n=2 Tax=Nematostella vectensis TaxID=45351 RepID=A7S8G6_NEMVE|nr:predicted protein [Nematostella vectensis]|eukprot:XP_001632002.1 predicted protein [Nematostella vectensis]
MNVVDRISDSLREQTGRVQNNAGFKRMLSMVSSLDITNEYGNTEKQASKRLLSKVKTAFYSVYHIIARSQDTIIDKLRGIKKSLNATTIPLPLGAYKDDSIRDRAFGPIFVERVFLLILITSHPKASSRRDLIRKTWAGTSKSKYLTGLPAKSTNVSPTYPQSTIYCVFTVGFANDAGIDRYVERESNRFGDILRINKRESYRNLVEKIQGSFEWALSVKPQYILKADDDVYVNMPKLISWLHSPRIPPKIYAGFVHYRAFIQRDPSHRWFVSRSLFPEGRFPPYCGGPFYLFSGNILQKIHKASLKQKRFAVEDAYFGVLARRIGIRPFDVGRTLWFWDKELDLTSTSWTNTRLRNTAVIGDGITDSGIQYLHERYKKIKQRR